MSADGLNQKLTMQQRQVMETNKCLMMMYTNQVKLKLQIFLYSEML